MTTTRGIATLVVLAIVASACTRPSDPPNPIVGSALESVGFDSLQDWVDFTDAVVVVDVVGEELHDPSPELPESLLERRVTLEVVDRLWVRDGHDLPVEIRLQLLGPMRNGDTERPMRASGSHLVSVGERYVLAVSAESKPPDISSDVSVSNSMNWEPGLYQAWTGSSVFSVDGDRLVAPTDGNAEMQLRLDGSTFDELRSDLAELQPSPLATKYEELDPVQRYEAVMEERYAYLIPEDQKRYTTGSTTLLADSTE